VNGVNGDPYDPFRWVLKIRAGAFRLKHSISISRRSIANPPAPLISYTMAPSLANLHAVLMAAPSESNVTGRQFGAEHRKTHKPRSPSM
jgi:hypothetical protein